MHTRLASPEKLRQLSWRVQRLSPDRHDPERYHIEKDAIARMLALMAASMEAERNG